MSRALIEVEGFPELLRRLRELANDRQRKTAMTRVLRKVASGTARVAKLKAPKARKAHLISGKRTRRVVQPGNLKKSIGVITGRKGAARENPTVYVGPRAKGTADGFYGNFVEYGHNVYRAGFQRQRSSSASARLHNNSGAASRTKAIPFMAQTYEQTKGQVTAETEKQVVAYIQKTIDRLSTR